MKILGLISALLFSSSAFAITLGEYSVVYAQRNLPQLMLLCQSTPECVKGVDKDLTQAQTNPPTNLSIEFVTSKELNEKLYAGPQNQVLQINRDKLYSADQHKPWDFADAVAFWVSIVSANTDLQSRLSALAHAQTQEIPNPDAHDVMLVYITAPTSNLVVSGTDKILPIDFGYSLHCAQGGPLQDVRVQSAQWMNSTTITGSIRYRCQDTAWTSNYAAAIDLSLDPNRLNIQQTDIQPASP
jgi:hypothetical protein